MFKQKKTILKHKKCSKLNSFLTPKFHNQILFIEMSILESIYQTQLSCSSSVRQNVWSIPMENNWTTNNDDDGDNDDTCNKRCGFSLKSCRVVLVGIVIGALMSGIILSIVITMWIQDGLLTKIQYVLIENIFIYYSFLNSH